MTFQQHFLSLINFIYFCANSKIICALKSGKGDFTATYTKDRQEDMIDINKEKQRVCFSQHRSITNV
jgi:hypothetical protein